MPMVAESSFTCRPPPPPPRRRRRPSSKPPRRRRRPSSKRPRRPRRSLSRRPRRRPVRTSAPPVVRARARHDARGVRQEAPGPRLRRLAPVGRRRGGGRRGGGGPPATPAGCRCRRRAPRRRWWPPAPRCRVRRSGAFVGGQTADRPRRCELSLLFFLYPPTVGSVPADGLSCVHGLDQL